MRSKEVLCCILSHYGWRSGVPIHMLVADFRKFVFALGSSVIMSHTVDNRNMKRKVCHFLALAVSLY